MHGGQLGHAIYVQEASSGPTSNQQQTLLMTLPYQYMLPLMSNSRAHSQVEQSTEPDNGVTSDLPVQVRTVSFLSTLNPKAGSSRSSKYMNIVSQTLPLKTIWFTYVMPIIIDIVSRFTWVEQSTGQGEEEESSQL